MSATPCVTLVGACRSPAVRIRSEGSIGMLEFDHEALSALGLTPALATLAAQLAEERGPDGDNAIRLTRIIEVHRDRVVVHDGTRALATRVAAALTRALQEAGTALAVGDWVLVEIDPHGDGWVKRRVPPASHIARRDADGRRHPVVSNVDVALLVMGLDDDFNPRRLERFLAVAADPAIVKVVVLTKADVAVSASRVDEQVAVLRDRVPPRVPIVAVNAMARSAAEALASYLLPGQTLVMLGSSGAGKSTLTNTLLGEDVQDTGAVRAHDSRGKHTTTSRTLHRLPGGACVIDTPGLRTLRPDAGASSVMATFDDIERLAMHCKFNDCRHGMEPGCAVRDGVDADRIRNYHKLLREVRRDTMTPLDRQKQLAQWKVRGKAAKERVRQKREGTAG
jgi:ribosome biogenesis GTPase